jgi:hypothetical protein
VKVIITVDTEADDQWSGSGTVETRNLDYIPRFQRLCEEFGLPPTYLCTYEVVADDTFGKTLKHYQDGGHAEIGAHLHPWTNPPFSDPTATRIARCEYPSYPSELPLATFCAKLATLTELIRTRTGTAPTSYRAGRWGFSAEHIDALLDAGYVVDCSVTPLIDRSTYKGVAGFGPDFRTAPVAPYMLDAKDICRPGASKLLEVPVTIVYTHPVMRNSALARRAYDRAEGFRARGLLNRALHLSPSWFRPYPQMNARRLRQVHDVAAKLELPVIEMMLHSSELMPGGSRSYKTADSIERLYHMLRGTFEYLAKRKCTGITLSNFARQWS